MFPISQRLGHGRTARGAFLCGPTGFDEDERLTSVLGFVGRHEDECGPSCIGYSFGQPVIPEHVTDLQFLESDPLVRVDDTAARLVQKVPAAVRYLLVDPGDFTPLLGSVLGALPLARKSALLALERLLGLLERTNGLGDSPIGRGEVVLET